MRSKELDYVVYPSKERTIFADISDGYDGAHNYMCLSSVGFEDGQAKYIRRPAEVRFVHKLDTGYVIPGLQSEQLAYILLDRVEKLNAKYPHPFADKMKEGLNMFLDACRERIECRIKAGVMGKLEVVPEDGKKEEATGAVEEAVETTVEATVDDTAKEEQKEEVVEVPAPAPAPARSQRGNVKK